MRREMSLYGQEGVSRFAKIAGGPCVELRKDTPERPHVDRHIVPGMWIIDSSLYPNPSFREKPNCKIEGYQT